MTLRFAVYGDPHEVAAYRAVARVYMRERPNVSVRVEATGDQNTAEVKLDRQFAAGTAPDLFLTNAAATTSLASSGRVQPVDELLEERDIQFADNYERLGLEAFAADDALQCMPSDVSPHVMFYNRRLFAAVVLGEPGEEPPTPQTGWTWEEFVSAAQQMSGPGVRGVHLAPDLTTLTPLLRSAGTDIVDDPRQPTTLQLSDGPTRTALEQILAVARNPRLTPTPAQLAAKDALTRFREGSVAMVVGTRALVPELRTHPGLAFDVFPLPALGRTQTIADVRGICISSASARIADAADFLAFASGQRGAALTARSGGIVPANLEAVHSEAFEQRGRWPLNVEVFTTVMRRADVMPSPPAWRRVVSATQPLVDRMFYAPVLNLDTLLPRIDRISAALLVEPTPSPSESPAGSPTGSPSP
ncbi:MAG TPA: extracellular solute-binding protein [Nocardioidaceae bacterium]|nr:extracellular solute-binding protein [Nocardioidaceae bacterium]